jgi:hypothetical protein
MKKIKSPIKPTRLHLDRQVVRDLAIQELGLIAGGTLTSAPTGVSGPPLFCATCPRASPGRAGQEPARLPAALPAGAPGRPAPSCP